MSTAEQKPALGIEVLAQYVKDFSFENPHAPESLLSGWPAPETAVQIGLQARNIKDDVYEALLTFKVDATFTEQNKKAFIIELSYAATARLNNVPKEHHQAVMMVELPKLLFPFAREVIARATQQGGYPPIYLQPMNFESAYLDEAKRRHEEKQVANA
jgi:preprotein translocase subunit SecB